ncbi:hypothetical protein ACEUB2_19525, partial [Aeromonas veronii]
INPESERATVDQRPVVLRPIGDGVKRFTHDADLRGMVVIRSLGFQLVPFKLHRFRKQRRSSVYSICHKKKPFTMVKGFLLSGVIRPGEPVRA